MQILIRKSIKTFQKPLITIFFRIFHINLLFIMKFHLFFRSKKTTELQKNKLSKKAINLFWENLIENENRQIYYDSDVISMWSFLIYTLMWRKKKLADKMWWKYKKQDTHILSFMLSNNLDECKNMKTQFETRYKKAFKTDKLSFQSSQPHFSWLSYNSFGKSQSLRKLSLVFLQKYWWSQYFFVHFMVARIHLSHFSWFFDFIF